jgi:IS5 family transposase
MRGADQQQSGMFSYISAERRVPKEHPLRMVRVMVDAALKELRSRFDELYASGGRPSIAPEKLLRSCCYRCCTRCAASVDFHGERRRNATHQSTTDPEARLARKGAGKEAKLRYAGHVEMDNRHGGLVVNTRLTQASGRAEPEAALAMVEKIAGFGRVTLGADKGYDQKELVRELREHRVTPHVAQKPNSAIDGRTTRRPGYLLSQRRRKRVEEIFGWLKTVGGLRKTRHRGLARVGWMFTFALAAYNLVRMRNLAAAAA